MLTATNRSKIKISREIIKKEKNIKKKDLVIITAGLPFGKAKMTNMIRLYEKNFLFKEKKNLKQFQLMKT